MSLPPPGRHSGAAHHEYCNSGLCCRCQMRAWTTKAGGERLCGLCASCCRDCGRAPAPHLAGLDGGLCAECRGLCGRCQGPRRHDGSCDCDTWRQRSKEDPQRYVLNALPAPLMQALGHRVPLEVHELIREELGARSAVQLRERIERRWNLRWAHALHELDEEGRRRFTPQVIAQWLIARPDCSDRHCEDGYLLHGDVPCGRCRRPTYRFVTSVADRTATPEHARASAAQIRRSLVANRARTPGRPH
ncbi:hypothetical protein [uncultured Streptomyces sp.]|uniref:hypothetical protein n=1 Tax=uncultured Streptomyces sp. TaxID=174707 RepID=UPI00262879B2|nr:hypothetical protein [uncultured Streptomyces sp.]